MKFSSFVYTLIRKARFGTAIINNSFLSNLFMRNVNSKDMPTESKAEDVLNKVDPKSTSTSIVRTKSVSRKYDLKIIIPVYNSEQYIQECLNSVINQKNTYKIKIQIINDGSTDKSADIISKYSKDTRIEIISQKNSGFSEARNTGLKKLESNYIMFLDSDDILGANSIQNLLDKAYETNSDIVEGSFIRTRKNKLISGISHKNMEDVDGDVLFGFPWGKIIKSSLFSEIQFPVGLWYEDTIISYLIYSLSKKNTTISDVVYVYRYNPLGITVLSKNNIKCIDTLWITELMLEEIHILKLKGSDRIVNLFFNQVILNFRRTQNMNNEVKKAIFVRTRLLLQKYFLNSSFDKKFDVLNDALLENNFKLYYIICALS
ncbi:glycosyltransferase, group 2 family protein (plasmid) [Lactiplantibacillus plantarum]|nr:glycosyltransferase, group 2 family protein [Lactiplantibacillus plantarum]